MGNESKKIKDYLKKPLKKKLNGSKKIKDYLEKTLKTKLQAEIDAYVKNYVHPDKRAFEIITYNEIALLSLVKSAMLRHEDPLNVWAMQEYEVFDKRNKFKGRADLYAFFKKPFNHEILIEAKRDGAFNPNSNKKYDEDVWNKEVEQTMKQGEKYYKHEAPYFSQETYLVTMFFGTLHSNVKDAYDAYEILYKPDSIDWANYKFYILNDTSQLLCVYGQIKNIKF